MTSDSNRPEFFDDHGGQERPNVSPELQDAIRSIDAIGENAWGKDNDQDVPRGEESAVTAPSPQDSPERDPDAPEQPEQPHEHDAP
jgi:hypothetical protein